MKLGISKGILETSHNKSIYGNHKVKSGVELVRRQVRISLPKIKPPTTGHSTHNKKSNKGSTCLATETALVMAEVAEKLLHDDVKQHQHQQQQQQQSTGNDVVVVPNPKPSNGLAAKVVDLVEKLIVKLMYDTSQPHHYLAGNFAPVVDETPPTKDLNVIGHLPDCLNGEFVRVGPNPKFAPVAGYHWFDGDGMIHGMRIKDGKATYVSRYVKTSRL
ncbi:hypothetical protein M0R45_036910 [Rubus argutus]|uniref:carotenoid 9,10-dioxygenase n=1 Tax=Rubus argutus TaxID=59490 RepID=A0AAW1VZ73_RUBAR